MCVFYSKNFQGEFIMNVINGIERLELIETVQKYGFAKGAEIYWLHRFLSLSENQDKPRRQIEYEIVEKLRLPKLSKSTFDKTMSLYNKILPKLMTYEVKSKLKLFTNQNKEVKNDIK